MPNAQGMTNFAAAYASRFDSMGAFEKFVLTLSLLIAGIVIVMGAMALIAWVTSLVESLEPPQGGEPTLAEPAPAQPAAPPQAMAQPAASPVAAAVPVQAGAVGANLDPNTVAVITASVMAVLAGRRFRIRNIQLATAAMSPWSQSGRLSIHASHAIERKTR